VSDATVLGIDPGTDKCGLAVVTGQAEALYRAVTDLGELPVVLGEISRRFGPLQVALGNRTGAARVEEIIRGALPEARVALVGEHRSTEEARRLYWRYHPPTGWRRLVPRGLLLPPEPLDAYAAQVVAQRWLAQASGRSDL
jgi:RNase H-fold protein (predicted Holliday junction resolvase)